MPSYIELDKQASLPTASNAGKVIFGINTAGEPEFTDSIGNTHNFGTGSLIVSSSVPYTEYFATITQRDSQAPTVDNVVINTLGFTPVWEYKNNSVYEFPFNKPTDSRKLISERFFITDFGTPINSYKVANDAAIQSSNFNNFNDVVTNIVPQSDGKIVVVGSFSEFNGNTANCITRLRPEGSIDDTFTSEAGFNDKAYSAAIQSNGKILVGGDFTNYNGTASNKIIRLNTSGSIDASFNIGFGFDGSIRTIAIQPDGKILVGGFFISYNDTAVNNIIRLNTNGSIDDTFNIGTGFNGLVNTIAIQSDGKILVGGEFTNYQSNDQGFANYIIRLNTDGSNDETFYIGARFSNIVNTIAIQPDGKILVGGAFQYYDEVFSNRIIRLMANGEIDNTFYTGAGFDNTVYTITIQFDDKILVGGKFTEYNNTAVYRIIRLNSNGSNDNANFLASTPGFNDAVRTIATLENGNILAGGDFSTDINSNYVLYYMALINNPYSYRIQAEADNYLNNAQVYLKLYN